ncbi:hypothetical protein E2C01_087646 [Portunus trituberculatus]|uniref:Uncharacterized protein n=1 Tax=Portunus trituberculatus TaxID=210409 RepID=A0A5B7J3Y2_PORTR|nr:hypothetical protein [Portunus trituberculatus]
MWSFGPAETPPSDWHVFKDMAKVRFSCQMPSFVLKVSGTCSSFSSFSALFL